MRPANERRCYNVTTSLFGWAHKVYLDWSLHLPDTLCLVQSTDFKDICTYNLCGIVSRIFCDVSLFTSFTLSQIFPCFNCHFFTYIYWHYVVSVRNIMVVVIFAVLMLIVEIYWVLAIPVQSLISIYSWAMRECFTCATSSLIGWDLAEP